MPMPKIKKEEDIKIKATKAARANIQARLSKKTSFKGYSFWIVGETPLITHAWSEKAKREMIEKQTKSATTAKDARNPHEDFVTSLYEISNGVYGFPATGIKNCIVSAAHKDKGVAKTLARSSIFILPDVWKKVTAAFPDAMCDLPLVRIYGSDPQMREDMVKIGPMGDTASFAYRAQFTHWAIKLSLRLADEILSLEQFRNLVDDAGTSFGLGEWRNERNGVFGAFRIGNQDENKAWDDFSKGKTKKVPVIKSQRWV